MPYALLAAFTFKKTSRRRYNCNRLGQSAEQAGQILCIAYLRKRLFMKVLVPVKRVIDFNVKVRVKSDQSDVDLTHVKMSLNPFCEIAMEEAVRLREAGTVDEVVAVSIGTQRCQEQLRTTLAMGADRAILIETDSDIQPLGVAKLLAALYAKEQPGLVLFGKQSIDGDYSQTGQMFAALVGLPQATFASKIDVAGGRVEVVREVDGGLQTISLAMPAVVTADLRLNEPRYASLPNIMKAKKKPMQTTTPDELGVTLKTTVTRLKVEPPSVRSAGVKVANVDELLDKLKNEAKVIS